MFVSMTYMVTVSNEYLNTHSTGDRPLPTMYLLMSNNVNILIECIIMYTTRLRPLRTMYALMADKKVLATEYL
jgi:hypothetical protein